MTQGGLPLLTPERIEKMKAVLAKRQGSLRVVLEEVRKPRNLSALLRTCDSVGIQFVHVVYLGTQPILLDSDVSKGAHRWVSVIQHPTIEDCLQELKADGFKIYCTHVDPKAKDFTEVDYTLPCAIVFGNEREGVSEKALLLSDERIVIPQVGFVNSLNVGTAAAVILYEAFKQRHQRRLYDLSDLSDEQREAILHHWMTRAPQ